LKGGVFVSQRENHAGYFFDIGESRDAYRWLGAHLRESGGADFRVWAPNAASVSVVGDFNGWDSSIDPMVRLDDGVWETYLPAATQWAAYKYAVTDQKGNTVLKSDPFAFHCETRPATASKVYDFAGYEWGDEAWMSRRDTVDPKRSPVNIYEVHAGSWRLHEDGNPLSYRELADQLVDYVRKMGYTHVEFMPLSEYPLDDSWGYQVTGYYAPTSRFGTPSDLMYLVDTLHRNGIGVILDWVGAHFPKDAHGLYEFDGTRLFEYSDPRRAEQPDWGTRVFDFGKTQVQSFLISNVCYWLKEYHFDGVRIDAVSSMLYLDFGRRDGEWSPNIYGGNENLEAVAFLKKLNTCVHGLFPSALMIAEESSAWPKITAPVSDGGLGFDFKWNMGWMNDILKYIETDPVFRRYDHNKLTFPLMYAFNENYILPISHDEVVHGKRSLLSRQHGNYDEQFAACKCFAAYMIAQPGKKLAFMGEEIGQFIEWNYHREIDWLLLTYDAHRSIQAFYRAVNEFYLAHPALWREDLGWDGFRWIDPDDADRNLLSFLRMDPDSGDQVACIFNFSPCEWQNVPFGLPDGTWDLALSNADVSLGGDAGAFHGFEHSVTLTVPGNGCVYLVRRPDPPKKPRRRKVTSKKK